MLIGFWNPVQRNRDGRRPRSFRGRLLPSSAWPALDFLVFAAAFFVLAIPSLYYAKPRVPVVQETRPARVDWTFFHNNAFWIFFVANVFQSLANFLPGIYLPAFAFDLKLSTLAGTLALALMNGNSCVYLSLHVMTRT